MRIVDRSDKPLIRLKGEIKSPPFSNVARKEAGDLLRQLQRGDKIGLPHSRPMPSIGPNCHELRVRDAERNWRLIYRIDPDKIVLVDVFAKKTEKTPKKLIDGCVNRLKRFDCTE